MPANANHQSFYNSLALSNGERVLIHTLSDYPKNYEYETDNSKKFLGKFIKYDNKKAIFEKGEVLDNATVINQSNGETYPSGTYVKRIIKSNNLSGGTRKKRRNRKGKSRRRR